jgi:uncharacterized phage-associated protein
MPVRARTVTNEFIRLARADGRRSLTPLQLIKLTYIAHGWMLALYQRPLIVDPIEAWKYGPVITDLYHSMKMYGAGFVTERLAGDDEILGDDERDLIQQVYRVYGRFNGIQLSQLTHQPGTPWYQTWNLGDRNDVISNDLIAEHYRQKMADEHRGAAR